MKTRRGGVRGRVRGVARHRGRTLRPRDGRRETRAGRVRPRGAAFKERRSPRARTGSYGDRREEHARERGRTGISVRRTRANGVVRGPA
eukprot:31227-Pelagococcus_subviridis.AAC.10